MKKWLIPVGFSLFCLLTQGAFAEPQRVPQFSNQKVTVWKTIVYPGKTQQLTMHHHDHDRVVIALTDGVLKVTNDQHQSHLLTLEKDHAYFLPKDPSDELHSDENVSGKPIKVMVVELK